jgi:hypothetical protein
MSDPFVIHIERTGQPSTTPVLWVPYHGATALAAATPTPYQAAIAALAAAPGADLTRIIVKRRRGVDLNEWAYPLAQAIALQLEDEQP